MTRASEGISRLLGALAERATRRPWTTIGVALILAFVSLAVAATRLDLKTSNLDLVDPDLPEVARFREFAERFGTPNMLVVALEGESTSSLRKAAARVAGELKGAPGVRAVLWRLPYAGPALAMSGLDPYFASNDRRTYYVFVQPDDPHSSAATIEPFVREVRSALTRADLPSLGVHAGTTGLPQYALDDRDVIRRDISKLSTVSFLLVLALFAASFGELRRPIVAMVLLALAAALVLGFASIVPGHLTLLSAFFFSALFGLGSDYGIFVVDRAEENMAEGASAAEAASGAVRFLAPGLATAALTTAAAFLTLTVSGFRGFAELGIIGAAGIVISLLAMTVVLPAGLALVRGRRRERKVSDRRLGRVLVLAQSPWLASGLILAAVAAALYGAPPFDGDYLDLQPKGSETVALERKMVEGSPWSPQFAAFSVSSPEKAKELAAALRREPTVASVRSASDLALLDKIATPIPHEVDAFRSSFVAADGTSAVYAYPAGSVWDPEFEERFLTRMREIDPGATGMPFLGRFMIDLSRRALRTTAALSAVVVLGLLWLEFGATRWTILAAVPTVLSAAGLIGAMRMLGLSFNPIDVMAFPVVIGTAVDAGVHLTHRFLAERGDVTRTLAGAGRTILVSGLTTIAGFGTLSFTAHRGLASFAIALTLGVSAALVFTLLVLPMLLLVAMQGAAVEEPA